jgi:hypothetical protein
MAFGNAKNILLGQKGNGDLGFYASFRADENWAAESGLNFSDPLQVLEWFKNSILNGMKYGTNCLNMQQLLSSPDLFIICLWIRLGKQNPT